MVDLFQGQLRSELQCGVCDKRSVTFDPFMYLSVPLPEHPRHSMGIAGDKGGISLEDCIRMYCKKETLEGGKDISGVKLFSNVIGGLDGLFLRSVLSMVYVVYSGVYHNPFPFRSCLRR